MFKYVLPVILTGGVSNRIGISKSILKNDNTYFVEKIVLLILSLGFTRFILSGKFVSYWYIRDIFIGYGPIVALYSVLFNKNIYNYRYILFIPVDMIFLTKEILLKLICHSDKVCCIVYKYNNFPVLFSILTNIKFLFFYCNYRYNMNSINDFFKDIFISYININFVNVFYFKNVNTLLELDMYNIFYKD